MSANNFIEKFKAAVADVTEVSAYKIIENHTKTSELYYVLDKLETTRATDDLEYSATIYVDKGEERGSATFTLYPYMDEEDIAGKITENVFAASFAMNPFYDLPSPEETKLLESSSSLKAGELKDHLKEIVDAVFKADTFDRGYLAATEFFLYKTQIRIVNSKGVDLTRTDYSAKVELIPSWNTDADEVEIYHMMELETIESEKITKEVNELLLLAKARAEAVKLKVTGSPKVILQDEEVAQMFTYYSDTLSYGAKYFKSNLFELGESVQGDKVTGDKLNLTMLPYYPGAMDSKAFDDDGVALKEKEIIKDGIAKSNHGSYRFGYYLGVDRPTGNLPVTVVKEGSTSFEEMKKEPYIRCVRFSGMQLDPNSGYIGGEVRLGFYFDGQKEVPVTGFSIAGNMHELKGSFLYSRETQTRKNFHGPKYVEVSGMNIL